MKKIYLTILSAFLVLFAFSSCKKTDIIDFSLKQGSVYFVENDINNPLTDAHINFASSNKGDSLRSDTLYVYLQIMGDTVSYDRQVYFTKDTIAGVDSTLMDSVIFDNPFTFRAGLSRDTLKVVVKRPNVRQQDYGVAISIDKRSGRDVLSRGVKEKGAKKIYFTDTYRKPDRWDGPRWGLERWYGEYSPEKHAFIQTILQISDLTKGMYNEGQMRGRNQQLVEALNAYNEAHPDNKKTFTFPQL